jgi:hypothetical protein
VDTSDGSDKSDKSDGIRTFPRLASVIQQEKTKGSITTGAVALLFKSHYVCDGLFI